LELVVVRFEGYHGLVLERSVPPVNVARKRDLDVADYQQN
jgi:hypothetical protein